VTSGGAVEPEGLPELTPAVYAELRAIARARMAGERDDHTLAPTALLHEAWLRLQGRKFAPSEHARFLAAASREMYRVLVDHARARGRQKRSATAGERVPLSAAELSSCGSSEEILAVEEALRRLERHDPRLAEVARLKVFADLEDGAAAQAVGTSERTARRDWALARAWLQRELSSE
jgi:RNA polymerase sigma factor (TIGR02999 family)